MRANEKQIDQPRPQSATDQPTVIRTGRGLTIAGTRTTLYQILDYIKAGWPSEQIQYLHRLSDDQMADILAYIESHRTEVEEEYRLVLRRAEENRRYWEEHNRERSGEAAAPSGGPERDELRAKLNAWKKRLLQEP